jgi:hypothetical protein
LGVAAPPEEIILAHFIRSPQLNPLPLCLLALCLAALPSPWIPAASAQGHVAHDLAVRLEPAGQRLLGQDRMVVTRPPDRLRIRLARKAQIEAVTVDDHKISWTRSGGAVEIPLPPAEGKSLTVTFHYSATFDDAAPRRPVNTDNPGYGVRGTISEFGTVLLAGSGWYPQVADMPRSIQLAVTAPAGTLAVTSGRLVGHTTQGDQSVSRWEITRPIGAVSLCAGPYLRRTKRAGEHMMATYFSPQRQHLADAYLDAGLSYLAAYSQRFGPYPFDHFAVVENFYPTGYGFPGFTLIGGRVLELPFIIPTSLRHEIAHCWWGNGVGVDASQGNWCEGLTTYVADYAHRLEQGQGAAQAYRRQLLRNFTSLVNPDEAFALNRFQARRDRVTKAIGYDKAAFVFHMLHQSLGDGFWQALEDLFRERCFTSASWQDLQAYFQRHADHNLAPFFDQWLGRRDAPRLRLEAVVYNDAAATLSGEIVQAEPAYDLDLDLLVVAGGESRITPIRVDGILTTFRLPLDAPPERVEADPGVHLFRRLASEEIPATINRLKAAGEVVVKTPPGADEEILALAGLLPRALGLETRPAGTQSAKAILWIGTPAPQHLPPGGRFEEGRLHLPEVMTAPRADTVFAVWSPPGSAAVEALYWSPTLAAAQTVARKLSHYGKYSYLAFDQATNLLKGTWPVTRSPLRVDGPVARSAAP